MGRWRIKKMTKGLRASRTKSKRAKIYIAIPPKDGWKGGDPSNNGYKIKSGR